jgi:Ca2+-binding EF-hand superfamily protein
MTAKEKYSKESINRLWKVTDTNNDGFIDSDEFLAQYSKKDQLKSRRGKIQLFKDIDTDLNGKITYSEFKSYMRRDGFADEEIDRLFRLGDANKDNVIDLNEFLANLEFEEVHETFK